MRPSAMKRFLGLILFACGAIALHAQSLTINSPSTGSVFLISTPVTISGTLSTTTITNVVLTVNTITTGTPKVVTLGGATITGTTWSFTWTPTAIDNYTVTATPFVADTAGTAASVNVTVTNGAPVVSLGLGGGGASMAAGSARFLIANAIDDGAIDHVDFILDGNIIGTASTPSFGTLYTLPFTAPLVVGSHQVSVKAYDNAGNSTASSFVTLQVTTPIGAAPLVGISAPIAGSFQAPGTSIAISGTASDSDGTVTTLQVFANGATIGTATVASGAWSLAWTPTGIGPFSITAIATDDKANATVSPAVSVNIADANSPTITLGISPNTSTTPASTTMPSGAVRNIVANVTPATGRTAVRVEFFVNGTKVGEKTTAPYSYRFFAPTALGNYVVSARATDNTGLARDAQTTFTVIPAVGLPPTVNLLTPTNNTTVVPNTAVSLAASALASGGTITSVQFYVNGSPANVNSGNAITAAPYVSTFTPTTPGAYVLDAIATDDRGNTAVSTIISSGITINAAFGTPTVSIVSPNTNATARAAPNVPLTISATATGGSGAAVLLVEYLLDGVQIGTRTTGVSTGLTTTYPFSWTPTTAQVGTHQITARVTDTNSLTATSAPLNVNVAVTVGTPPAITISTSPVPAAGLQTLSTVNFLANAFANGTGSTITSVEFFLNDQSIGLAAREQTTNVYRLTYDFSRYDFSALTPDPSTGRYAVTLYGIAKDSNNNQTVSTVSTLQFTPSTSAPPTVTLQSLGGNAVAQNSQFPLLATPNDNDGTIASLQLFANGAVVNNATITSLGTQFLVTYPSPTAGRFNLYVVATDDSGNTAVSTPAVVLNVTALGTPTTAVTRPSDDSTVTTAGAPVFLEATASSPDTTGALTVQFIPTASSGARGTAITATRVGTTNTYRAVFTTTTADTYTISSSATFSGVTGNSANSRKVVVRNVTGIAPTVTINSPTSGTNVSSASTTNLVATATDADGAVVSVEFFLNRNSIGQATRDPQANTWRLQTNFAGITPATGIELVAIATDSSGNIAASTTNTINIVAATSAAPTVTLNVNPTSVAFGQPVALTANASDVDGNVNTVQYFVNGASVGTSGNAGTNYLVNFTSTTSGTFNVFAVATDNSSGTANTAVSATQQFTVKRNNPIVEDDAFIQQTFTDITNSTVTAARLADYDAQLAAKTITRAQIVTNLTQDNVNFTNIVNALAAYRVLMGFWPTAANYTTIFNARGNLSTVCSNIVASQEFAVKYQLPIGVTLTTTVLDNPSGPLPEATFLAQLFQNAGLGSPSSLDLVQFKNNPTAITTSNPPVGRGYDGINPATGTANGLNAALADFITVRNANNPALFNLATAAALYYQLDKPNVLTAAQAASATPPFVTQDAVATRIAALAALNDPTAAANSILNDILYTYRFVTFLKQPQSLTVAPRSGALFSVEAMGQPPLRYQWLLNGAPIVGATSPLLSVTNVDTSKVGTYTVAVSSAVATATSDPATLTLSSTLTKLGNISTRGVTGAGPQALIAGFVVTHPAGTPANQTRQMLIRVIGPSLASQGLTTGVLADPRLEVYGPSSATVPILTNDNWGTQTANAATNATAVAAIQQAAARVGAFALTNTSSADAVVLATLAPGNYTVQAKGPNNAASGIVLVEVYDASPASSGTTPKAVNVSTRGPVGTGANSLIAGFVINGAVSRRVLIRGVGPTLANFGLANAGVLADPQLELFDSANVSLRKNDDWATGDDAAIIAAAAVSGGAFPLANGSKDAAMLVMLAPGAYTVQLTGTNNTTGLGLVEVYDVDP